MRLWKGKIKMLWAILSTLLVGAVAGWLASKIMGGGGSLVRNIAVGVIGSCVGGLLFGLLGAFIPKRYNKYLLKGSTILIVALGLSLMTKGIRLLA